MEELGAFDTLDPLDAAGYLLPTLAYLQIFQRGHIVGLLFLIRNHNKVQEPPRAPKSGPHPRETKIMSAPQSRETKIKSASRIKRDQIKSVPESKETKFKSGIFWMGMKV
eukprot:sb/3477286/